MQLTQRQRNVLQILQSKVDPKTKLAHVSMLSISRELCLNGGGAQVASTISSLILKGFIERISNAVPQEGNSYKILKTK